MSPHSLSLHVAASTGLAIACLDALLSILEGVTSLPHLLAAAAATFIASSLVVLAALLAVRLLLRRREPCHSVSLACALATFLASYISLARLFRVQPLSLTSDPLMTLGLIAAGSVLATVAWLLSEGARSEPSHRIRATTLALVVPLLLAEAPVSAWLYVTVTILPRYILLLTILVVLLTVWLCHRPAVQVRSRGVIVGISALLLTAAASTVAWSTMPTIAHERSQAEAAGSVRRIVLVSIDTLRADAISAIGAGLPKTPHIDSLADDGIVFTQARSGGPWTLAGVASLMTGLPATVHRVTRPDSTLAANSTTLAEALQEAGYETAAFGDNPFLRRESGMAQGFETYEFFPKLSGWDSLGAKLLRRASPDLLSPTATTERLTDLAIAWVESNHKRDFFLWLHYLDPHGPYRPPESHSPKGEAPSRFRTGFAQAREVRMGALTLSQREREWVKELYDAEVRYVDEQIGRVLERLRHLRIYDDALIVLTSDHGEEFWEHGGFEHGHSVYDEVLRVPLIIKLPGHTVRTRISEPVSTQAIFSTVLDVCGIVHQEPSPGTRSLVGAWEEAARFDAGLIISTGLLYYEDRVALLRGDLKYIRELVSGREELYDLRTDPREEQSLASSEDDRLDASRALLLEHEKRAAQLRLDFQLEEPSFTPLDPQTTEMLRAVGYLE